MTVLESAKYRSPLARPVYRVAMDADDAREGVTGHNVRYVLGASLAATVLGLAALFAFWIG